MALLRARPLIGSLLLHGTLLAGMWTVSLHLKRSPEERSFVLAQSATPVLATELQTSLPPRPVELEPPKDEPPPPEFADETIPEPEPQEPLDPLELRFGPLPDVPHRQKPPPPPEPEPLPPMPPPTATQEAAEVVAIQNDILDAERHLLHGPAPTYPRRAYQLRIEGEVVLLARVDREGDVTDTEVEKSSGHDVLDRAAQKALKKWRFRPRVVRGLPIPYRARATFVFQIPKATTP